MKISVKLMDSWKVELVTPMRRMNHLRWTNSWIDFQGDGRFSKERIKHQSKRRLRKWTLRKMKELDANDGDNICDG